MCNMSLQSEDITIGQRARTWVETRQQTSSKQIMVFQQVRHVKAHGDSHCQSVNNLAGAFSLIELIRQDLIGSRDFFLVRATLTLPATTPYKTPRPLLFSTVPHPTSHHFLLIPLPYTVTHLWKLTKYHTSNQQRAPTHIPSHQHHTAWPIRQTGLSTILRLSFKMRTQSTGS